MINASLARSRPISGLLALWSTSIGKKYVMAITGAIWFGYLILHLWGNLRIYGGAQALNEWGTFLRVVFEPFFLYSMVLWIARIILIPAILIHVLAAYQLTRQDWAARPRGYALRKNLESTFSSRTMRWGGVVIAVFIVYHVLDLTFGVAHVGGTFEEGDIYHNVVTGFSVPWVSAVYIVGVIAVGFHLYHGIWSMFQTMGWNSSRSNRLIRNTATFFALVLTALNVAIPISVLTGFVTGA